MYQNSLLRFHDLSELPDGLVDFFMAYVLAEAITSIRRKYINLKNLNFCRTLGWCKVGFHLISFVAFSSLGSRFEQTRLKRLGRICDRIVFYNMGQGLGTFREIEPEASEKAFRLIKRLYDDYRVYKLTGMKTALLQKVPSKFILIMSRSETR